MTRFSPNCRDFVPESIERKVNGFDLSSSAKRLLWDTLRAELRNRRDSDFVISVAPVPCLILRLSIADNESACQRDFAFYISNRLRPGVRVVIDAIDLASLPYTSELEHPPRPEYTD